MKKNSTPKAKRTKIDLAILDAVPLRVDQDEVIVCDPELKPHVVHLTATSVKDVFVDAHSPADAEAFVKELYFHTDILDFTDEDVVEVNSSVVPNNCSEPGEREKRRLELAAKIVHLIRGCDEPDEVIARIVDKSLLYYLDHPDEPIQGV